MKKIFFFAATAALALSSCTSDELAQDNASVVEDGAVSFSAYQGRANRAVTNDATVTLANKGFGVFAYEQGTSDWANYVTSYNVPNFMYNQRVQGYDEGGTLIADGADKDATTIAEWKYTPVKYFSNVPGAKHSFFAYAPWNENIEVKFYTTGPKIHYNMNERPYDLLWGHVKDAPTATYIDLTKQNIDYKIDYTFEHTLTQVNVDLSYFADVIHNGTTDEAHTSSPTPSEYLAEGTKIIVRSVKLEGPIATEGELDLATGKWTYTNVDAGAFEKSDIVFTSTDRPDVPKDVFKNFMILPPMEGNKVKIKVVYDVETIDASNPSSDLNNHVVTNKWESEELTLEKGHAYTYHLHIGMTSVKFNAEVSEEWTDEDEQYIDLPEVNVAPGLAIVHYVSAATAPVSCKAGDVYYNTENGNYYEADTDNHWADTPLTVNVVYYDAATGKYYNDAAFTDPAAGIEPAALSGYYKVGGVLFKNV